MIRSSVFSVADLNIELQRKRIKNLHLRVLEPDGRVRVSAPLRVSKAEIEKFVLLHHEWIVDMREKILSAPPVAVPQYTEGDVITLLGRELTLRLCRLNGRRKIDFDAYGGYLLLEAKSTPKTRERWIYRWYAEQMQQWLDSHSARWEALVGQHCEGWSLRRMKSKWGSCLIHERKITLNTELMRYPEACLEYVLVHELVHLYERGHNARFYNFMTRFLPDWKQRKQRLNALARNMDEDAL